MAHSLAHVLRDVLAGGPAIEAIVARGQADTPVRFSLPRMINHYETVFAELLNPVK